MKKLFKYLHLSLFFTRIRKYCQQPKNKKIHVHFLRIKRIKSGKTYMNKHLCKKLDNIDKNKTVRFGVCECSGSGDFWPNRRKNCLV